MVYKKRTEIAESTALEKKGRRESKLAPETAKPVIRSLPESAQMLGSFTLSILIGEFWTQDQWRRGWDSNPRYACTHNGFRDRPDRPLWHLSAAPLIRGRFFRGNRGVLDRLFGQNGLIFQGFRR